MTAVRITIDTLEDVAPLFEVFENRVAELEDKISQALPVIRRHHVRLGEVDGEIEILRSKMSRLAETSETTAIAVEKIAADQQRVLRLLEQLLERP